MAILGLAVVFRLEAPDHRATNELAASLTESAAFRLLLVVF